MKATSNLLLLVCVFLCGCAGMNTITMDTKEGRDFDETKVSQITKLFTTANDVVKLYGDPDSKEIVSTNQVMWHYTYLNEVDTSHSGVEQTTGSKKNLDILFQDDIVINFSYVNAPIQSVIMGSPADRILEKYESH